LVVECNESFERECSSGVVGECCSAIVET